MNTSQVIARSKLRVKPLIACLTLPLAVADVACTSVARAATLPVANCNDAGSGSLRAALAVAHSGDSVDLRALRCSEISIATGELQVAVNDLALQGPGADALTITGSNAAFSHHYSVIHHTGHGTLRIDALRISDKRAGFGRTSTCIASSGTVDLNRSVVTECSTGAALANGFVARDSTISNSNQGIQTTGGSVSIIGSTINGNQSYLACVALQVGSRGTATAATVQISNSTISGNHSWRYYGTDTNYAGCIYQPVTISNSTIAFNSERGLYIGATEATIESSILAHNNFDDLSTPGDLRVTAHDNVIPNSSATLPASTITADPLLLPLADNGGPTRTHALAAGSPAIDTGNNVAALASDQRGLPFARSAGAKPDIGAFELQPAPATSLSIGPGFTGSWFDPAQSGHGLMLEVLSDHRVLAMWFAFNPEGNQQSWFGGVGTYSGATATITDVALPTGGRWIPNFDPDAIARNPWGTLTFTFTDCSHGRVDFSSVRGYGSGSMNLLRLTQPAGSTCP